jgi:class 3 adenylate cyclase
MQLKTGEANLHIYCDRDGIIWTSNWLNYGIYELQPFDPLVKRYAANPSAKNTLSSGLISTIVPGPQGKLWLGTAEGLNIFDPVTETFEVLRARDLPGIKGTSIIPIYIDTIQQKAWLNTGSQESEKRYFGMSMYEMDIKTRKCSRIIFMDGSKRIDTFIVQHGTVRPYKNGFIFYDDLHGVFEIKEGSLVANLLIPVPRNLGNILLAEDRYLFLDHGSMPPNSAFENKNGKWTRVPNQLDRVFWFSALYNKRDQTYWVSEENSLVHYNKGFQVIKAYGERDGYNGPMLTMQFDDYGNLWFANFSKQIGRLNMATGIFSTLSETDGYQKLDFDWTNVPITKDVRGDLYFGIGAKWGTGDLNWGLDRVSPERLLPATSSVYVNALFINQKPFSSYTQVNELGELSLKHYQNTISIETGIIDYYAIKKGKIRYKLGQNGKEGDWQYPPDYIIRYESLSPGSYRLVVQASNINNEFSSPEKILNIVINPPFWQTWWFRTIAAVSLLLLFYGIYRWRTATLRKQKRVLEETVKIRTAEVVKQKEKSDELLLNILPSEVADELKEKGYTTARSYEEVTVFFSDIKGFSHVAEKLSAQELVKEIDTYFSAFDRIMKQHGLEKIKTIGDAYIAAAGLPEKNSATADDVIRAAIEMQQTVEILKQERVSLNKPYFELRIGIHTGPVVAGVVGIKKFQYDIWGDTVNLAARMEQSGVPGKINISQQTYKLVKEQFTCVHRGKIEAKNKGMIDMYFVETDIKAR